MSKLGITTRQLYIELTSELANENCWPCIDVSINSKIVYSGQVEQRLSLNITFDSHEENHISLAYTNKRFGPDVWDTIVDSNGNIVKDQHIKIQNIRIDECNLDFLIPEIPFKLTNETFIKTNGYLGFNGNYNITFSEPYYDWVHSTRLSLSKNTKIVDSSLPFITSYVYEYDNQIIADLLNKLQETVNAAKNFNYNNTLS